MEKKEPKFSVVHGLSAAFRFTGIYIMLAFFLVHVFEAWDVTLVSLLLNPIYIAFLVFEFYTAGRKAALEIRLKNEKRQDERDS